MVFPLLSCCFAGRTALHRALGGGFAECARFLIENGADPNKADALKRTPLHWAAMGPAPGNVECCELIFEKGDGQAMLSKETKSGSTPLHSAAGTNRPEVVKFLVEKQADLTLKDELDTLPAREKGRLERDRLHLAGRGRRRRRRRRWRWRRR